MTAANCPTCDREGCDSLKMPGWAPYECVCGGFDCPLCRAAQDCERHAVDWRARALAAEADAARWRKVAPLIERLRDARYGCTSEGEYDAVTAIVILDDGAATQEPTP